MELWQIGVDEAGRGPLAGPVAVGAVLVQSNFDWSLLSGVADSKKLSAAARDLLFSSARELQKEQLLDFQVTLIGAPIIDRIGIVPAVHRGVARTMNALLVRNNVAPAKIAVKLDGALRAPSNYPVQETVIGGDGKEKCIGLASILAKVTRDRHMARLAKRYPEYGFEVHKGYGTKRHRSLILLQGLSDVHRRSFCTRLQV